MLPDYYEFYNPVKIISGKLAVDNIPYEMDLLKVKRAMLVTDQGVVAAGLMDVVVGGFSGAESEIAASFQETPPDSSMEVVRKVADIYRENDCDCLIAVGGGSVIDTAKGANVVITEGGDSLLDFQGADQLKNRLQPLIVVPSTAGTGSEVTRVAIVADRDKNVKVAMTSAVLLPKLAVLDPRMTLTMPRHITAATGMDALTHAIEAYSCLQKNPLSDSYAVTAIALVRDYLVRAVETGSDETARMGMANAALLAGVSFSNAMVGMVHSLAHATGGVCHVPHGVANAIFLPFSMEYNMDRVRDYYAELLPFLAGFEKYAQTPPEDRADASVEAVRELNRKMNELSGMPITLKDAGVPAAKLEEIAQTAINDGSLTMNPEEMDVDQAMEILKKAFE